LHRSNDRIVQIRLVRSTWRSWNHLILVVYQMLKTEN